MEQAKKLGEENLIGDFQLPNDNIAERSDAKDYDFEHIDPQAFVQRMSAGAKEAQEQLDAKFAQGKNDLNDFLGQTTQNLKEGVASITSDFMNAERGLMANAAGGDTKGMNFDKPYNTNSPKNALINETQNEKDNSMLPMNIIPNDNGSNAVSITEQKPVKAYNKDSDTDSPSVSYNPSPAKKLPKSDALKEQENEKFISSEDLLSDFDERKISEQKQQQQQQYIKGSPIIDLDADDDDDDGNGDGDDGGFVQAEIPKISEESIQSNEKENPSVIKPTPITIGAAENKQNVTTEIKANTETKSVPSSVSLTKPVTSKVMKDTTSQQAQIISVEDMFYKYGLDAWFKPDRLHPQVESLIYWRDVKKSGVVFGAGLITLLAISCFSVISVFAYLSLFVLTGTVSFRIYKSVMQAVQKTCDGHPFKEYLEYDLTLSQDKVQHIAGVAVAHLNGFVSEMRRLFLVEDLIDSIKFGVILCVLTYIGAWFNGMTLVLMAFVSLFTLPKVYENNKQSIDTYLDLARSKVTEITEKIKATIPLGGTTKKALAAETDKDK